MFTALYRVRFLLKSKIIITYVLYLIMDNRITEYRVRMLKFDNNYCDKTLAVNENPETPSKKLKNSAKVNAKQPETSRPYRIIPGQTCYRIEKRRISDNQVEKKCVKQVPVHQNRPINHNKIRRTVDHFPSKGKIFTK